jgi:muconate cycloisomerase
MRVEGAELFFLQIPLRLSISHGARSGRVLSDSIVLKLSAADGSAGFGEAVAREYVSGSLEGAQGFREEAARRMGQLLAPLRGRDISWPEISSRLAGLECETAELPLLCALETAFLDIACGESRTDVYQLLGREPVRQAVTYGGALPILPMDQAGKYIAMYAGFRFPNLKVKLGADLPYNGAILSKCREILGDGFDIRVDANAAWRVEDAEAHLDLCSRYGVRVIEQPFPVLAPDAGKAAARARQRGFLLVADEGFLTARDVAGISSAGTYRMLNLRLSKNGGLLRVLSLAEQASACGLSYQLGCMVGETGILSALGRVAASLLREPLYVEGGYDDVLLSENITTRSFGFGPGGSAGIVRGPRIGFEVDAGKLSRLSAAVIPCA